jgi:hypothetical protein
MVVTLEEGSNFRFSVRRRRFPRRIIYRNVEFFLGSEIAAYTGMNHGRIYNIPEIRLNRILLTPGMRDQLRVQVIFTKQKIVMCMLWVRQSKQFLDPPSPSSINFEHNQQ